MGRKKTGWLWILTTLWLVGCFVNQEAAKKRQADTPPQCKCTKSPRHWPAADRAHTPAPGGVLRIRLPREPAHLLAMYSGDQLAARVANNDLLEPLVKSGSAPGLVVPALASSWEMDKSGTRFTFKLDRRARWHDGVRFSAKDVVTTFELLRDPAGGAAIRRDLLDVADVTAPNDETVVITIDAWRPDFLLSLTRVMMLPAHICANTNPVASRLARAPVGTGPFRFVGWQPGKTLELAQNTAYRDGRPHIAKIRYRFVPENRLAVALLKSRELDVVINPGEAQTPDTSRELTFASNKLLAVVFNLRHPIFKDVAVRRAIAHLIDNNSIGCSIFNCLADEGWSRWASVMGAFGDPPHFNPTRARKILLNAGFADHNDDGLLEHGHTNLDFTFLLAEEDSRHKRVATVVASDLAKVGIQARQKVVSHAAFVDQLQRHRFQAALVSLDSPTPFGLTAMLDSHLAATGENISGFNDEFADQIIENLNSTSDDEMVKRLRQSLAVRVGEQLPMLFVVSPYWRILVDRRVHQLKLDGERIDKRQVWISKGAHR